MKNDPKKLLRYTPFERANHWLTAITFILAVLSGLSFFHPAFFPLSGLFGGGTWTRILHPFIGVVMAFFFLIMFFNFCRSDLMTASDWKWLGHVGEMVKSGDRNMPESGKFNGGQKLLFWLQVLCMLLLVLSGLVIWRAYLSLYFPVEVIRLAYVVHAGAAALMIILIIIHIYAAIWTKESISGMLYGWVRRAWAKQHHPAWFRQMTGGGK